MVKKENSIALMMNGGLMMAGVVRIVMQTGHGKALTNPSDTMQNGLKDLEKVNMIIQRLLPGSIKWVRILSLEKKLRECPTLI